jgi:recombination protein RecT
MKDKVENVRTMLERMKGQMLMSLPRHITPDRMIRLAMTTVQRTPELLECEPRSLAGALLQASQLGLEPDGVLGQAYLVPFRNNKTGKREVQFIAGYKGLVSLARRSGEVSSIDARVVREGDRFAYSFGLSPTLTHSPAEAPAATAPITHAYAVIKLKDGGHQFDVMTKAEIDAIRAQSRAGQSGPWVTHEAEMAKKTVLRRALKLAPMSVEAHRAVALDELAEDGVPQDLDGLVDTHTGEVLDASPVTTTAPPQP